MDKPDEVKTPKNCVNGMQCVEWGVLRHYTCKLHIVPVCSPEYAEKCNWYECDAMEEDE